MELTSVNGKPGRLDAQEPYTRTDPLPLPKYC